MKYFFDKTTYSWFHQCTKFLYCKVLILPMDQNLIQAKEPDYFNSPTYI